MPPAPDLSGAAMTRLAATVTGLVALGLYLSTLTSANTFDAVVFSMFTERAVAEGSGFLELYHPQHVLHLPVAAVVLRLLHAAGLEIGALVVLQLLAAVSGGALAFLLVRLLAPSCGGALAAASSLGCAVTGGIWFYATDGENNVVALAIAAAALGPALRVLEGGTRRDTAWAGALLGLAAALHLTLGTLWIALLAVAATRGRSVLRDVVLSLALASALLALAYVPRLLHLAGRPEGASLLDLVVFTGDSVGGGYLLRHGFQPLGELGALLKGSSPSGPWLARGLAATWLAAGVAALALRRGPVLLRVSAVWLAANVLLFAAWSNLDFEFTGFMLVPLALLGATALAALAPGVRARSVVAAATGAAALALGLVNWRSFIAPRLDPAAVPARAAAELVLGSTAPGDLVLVTGLRDHLLKVYVPYWSHRATFAVEHAFGPTIPAEESVRRLRERVAAACARGARVHVLPDVLDAATPSPAPFDARAVRDLVLSLEPAAAAVDASGAPALFTLRRCP